MPIEVVDCFDCANAQAAKDLLSAGKSGGAVHRDVASSGHEYKRDLVEAFGSAICIDDARAMMPQCPDAKVNPLFLANEIYLYVTSDTVPPIWRYWPWDRVAPYYARRDRIIRPYGYWAQESPGYLTVVIESLRRHPTTKRCVVPFHSPEFIYPADDTPCTLSTQYRILDGRLCSATTFRSHDYFGGFRTDPLRISFVQQFIAAGLRTMDAPGDVGSLTTFDGSLHYYPNKPHGALMPIAKWTHRGPAPRSWELFTADYSRLDQVFDDLYAYCEVVRHADEARVLAIRDRPLRELAQAAFIAICHAREKFAPEQVALPPKPATTGAHL